MSELKSREPVTDPTRKLAGDLSDNIVRKRGRPSKPQAESRREPVSFRTTPELRDRITEAAEASGRSVTQELELRLESSLALDNAKLDAETQSLLAAVGQDIARAQELTGKRWQDDLATWAMVREALGSGEIEARNNISNPEADPAIRTLRWYEEKLEALNFAMAEMTGWLLPLNMPAMFDPMLPRFLYDDSRQQLEQGGGGPDERRAHILKFIERMEAIEAERLPTAKQFQEQQRGIIETVTQAVRDWHSDYAQRGKTQARMFRPSFAYIRPVFDSDGDATGIYMQGDPNPLFAKYMPSGAPKGNHD